MPTLIFIHTHTQRLIQQVNIIVEVWRKQKKKTRKKEYIKCERIFFWIFIFLLQPFQHCPIILYTYTNNNERVPSHYIYKDIFMMWWPFIFLTKYKYVYPTKGFECLIFLRFFFVYCPIFVSSRWTYKKPKSQSYSLPILTYPLPFYNFVIVTHTTHTKLINTFVLDFWTKKGTMNVVGFFDFFFLCRVRTSFDACSVRE